MKKNTSKRDIRVAMIRCDTHAYWYGPFMFACDPLKLQVNNCVCHHFFTNMYHAARWEIPREPGMRLAKVYDANRAVAEKFAGTFPDDAPEVCDHLEDLTKDIDAAFIANCDLDAADHLKLATPFLKKGIPLFIDKPFAGNWKDAKAIVGLARKHRTPMMSCSLLMHTDEVPNMLKRRGEVGPLRFGVVKGVTGWATPAALEGIAHGVAMALATFGYDVESVQSMGDLPLEFISMRYTDGRQMLVMNTDSAPYSGRFVVEVWGERSSTNTPVRTNLQSEGTGDPEFCTAGPKVVKLFKKMVQTGKPPIPYEETLMWMKVIEAARRSQRTGKKVLLRSFQ